MVKRLRHRPFTAITRVRVPVGSLYIWKLSSVGRASALQAEGHRFEPYSFHLDNQIDLCINLVIIQRPGSSVG